MKEVSLLGIWGKFLGLGRRILMGFSKRVWGFSEHELRARERAVTSERQFFQHWWSQYKVPEAT